MGRNNQGRLRIVDGDLSVMIRVRCIDIERENGKIFQLGHVWPARHADQRDKLCNIPIEQQLTIQQQPCLFIDLFDHL